MKPPPRIPLAWLNLTNNRVRMALFCAGIGFAVLLMFVQFGCYNALLDSSVLLLQKFRTDLVIVNRQQTTLLLRSTFDRHLLARARSLEGVTSVHPVYLEYGRSVLRNTERDEHRRNPGQTIRVIGIDPDAFLLDFPLLDPDSPQSCVPTLRLEGRALFDRLSKSGDRPGITVYGPIEPGTTTDLAGQQVVIVGLFELGVDFGTDGTLLVNIETFGRILRSSGPLVGLEQVDVGLVRLVAGANRRRIKGDLQRLLGNDVEVLTKEEFVDREQRFWKNNTPIGSVFGFGMGMGFLVGLVICYQILSTDIRDNLPAYATLRAIGYPNRYLALVVLEEAILLAGLGFVPGLLISWGFYELLAYLTDLPMRLTTWRIGFILFLTIVMCIVSGLLAVRQAQEADPAEVF
jgi:putative ABC transport system permease protein